MGSLCKMSVPAASKNRMDTFGVNEFGKHFSVVQTVKFSSRGRHRNSLVKVNNKVGDFLG